MFTARFYKRNDWWATVLFRKFIEQQMTNNLNYRVEVLTGVAGGTWERTPVTSE